MKQSQLIGGVVALAALVFVVTFTMNYLGTGGSSPLTRDPGTKRTPLNVTFSYKVIPPDLVAQTSGSKGQPSPELAPYLEAETGVKGFQDYWFSNPNEEALDVGLFRKSCKCASVLLFLPTEEWQGKLLAGVAGVVGQGSTGPFGALATQAAEFQLVQAATEGKELFDQDSVRVAPGALGWVRLGWTGQQSGRQNLNATLWMDRKEEGRELMLEARVLFHDPVRLKGAFSVGTLHSDDLPHTIYLRVWSSTRKELNLRAEPLSTRDRKSDPFSVGTPIPMTAEEMESLEKQNNETVSLAPGQEGRVLCGYKIPVKLERVAPDGVTPFDLGPFSRWVLVHTDVTPDPFQVAVYGRVRGHVTVITDEVGGGVNLSGFPQSKGKRQLLVLHTDLPDLKLEFDRTRTAAYLDAKLLAPPTDLGEGRKQWKFRVEALPGKASGPFPRREDPAYQDSAVYLQVTQPGQKPRSIRIPVSGTANAG